jgi:septum formation protein
MTRLVLASTSPYRKALLTRLGVPFTTKAPRVPETARDGEGPADLAARLALTKAEAVAAPGTIVVGADQVAALGARILQKPGMHAVALEQLLACQAQTVEFHTAVAVIDISRERVWQTVDRTAVHFARLPAAALDRYLHLEQPYDCAGGFKAEGLGIALFERIESADPTALIGLPLIWVAATLRAAGLDPLAPSSGPR